ncbi:MAG: hypothetical protein KBD01_02040 [Acidobacteria bacterium]|nr:hypothetical protein [Acidobacteriota bacterium]
MTSLSARKSSRGRRKPAQGESKFVTFNWEGQDYVLDLARKRVYQKFMAVEANKGFTILGAYRQVASVSA